MGIDYTFESESFTLESIRIPLPDGTLTRVEGDSPSPTLFFTGICLDWRICLFESGAPGRIGLAERADQSINVSRFGHRHARPVVSPNPPPSFSTRPHPSTRRPLPPELGIACKRASAEDGRSHRHGCSRRERRERASSGRTGPEMQGIGTGAQVHDGQYDLGNEHRTELDIRRLFWQTTCAIDLAGSRICIPLLSGISC
jgi:hypothetical protein